MKLLRMVVVTVAKLLSALDRIDNSKGHTKDNVRAACIRCNYMRGSMPFEAWEFLVPTIKEAVKRGLFGKWRSKSFNLKLTDNIT